MNAPLRILFHGLFVILGGFCFQWPMEASGQSLAEFEDPLNSSQQAKLKMRDEWQRQIQSYRRRGKWDEAIEAVQQVLQIEREVLGETSDDVKNTLELLESLQLQKDDLESARKTLAERIDVEEARRSRDPWHLEDLRGHQRDLEQWEQWTAEERRERMACVQMTRKALDLSRQQQIAEAIRLAESVLSRQRQIYTEERYPQGSSELSTSLHNLASYYHAQGNHVRAVEYETQALSMDRQLYRPDRYPYGHPDLAAGFTSLGAYFAERGELERALEYRQQGVDLYRQLYAPDRYPEGHAELAVALEGLGGAHYERNEYMQAIECFRQSLAMREQLYPSLDFPHGHPDVAQSLNLVGVTLWNAGDYARATGYLQRALEMDALLLKEMLPQGHPHLVNDLNVLGMALMDDGQYTRAENYLRQALEMHQRLFRPEDDQGLRDLAVILNNLGLVQDRQHHTAQAVDYYREALRVCQRLYPTSRYPEGHAELAMALNNLGGSLQANGDLASAVDYQQQAVEMNRRLYAQERFPQGHPSLAMSLVNLSDSLFQQGDPGQATRLIQEATEMNKRLYPLDQYPQGHPSLSHDLTSLARISKRQGDYARAIEHLEQAVAMNRRLFPVDRYPHGHATLATTLENLGVTFLSQHDYAQALSILEQAVRMKGDLSELYLATVGESQALTFLATMSASRSAFFSAARHLPDSDERCYAIQWATKGSVARMEMLRRLSLANHSDPQLERANERLSSVRRQLAQLLLAPPDPDSTMAQKQTERVKQLTVEKESLERELASQLPELAELLQSARRHPAELIAALPPGVAFIDCLQYTDYDQDPQQPGEKGERATSSYTAFLLYREGPVLRIELGPAEPIDTAVQAWRQQLSPGEVSGGVSPDTTASHSTAPDADTRLRQLIWEPIEKQLPTGTTTIVVCPDAQLTALPWAALPGRAAETVLLEEYAISTVPSGPFLLERLIAHGSSHESEEQLLIVGAVDYDHLSTAQDTVGGVSPVASRRESSSSRDATLDPEAGQKAPWRFLEGSLDEMQRIDALAGDRSTIQLSGADASEDRVLRELTKVRFAHFATHGFFTTHPSRSAQKNDAQDSESLRGQQEIERNRMVQRSPLVMSGLVLSGANRERRKNAWGVPIDQDGILTAEELVGLDLSSLDLAVLSACETGLGQVAAGEGVFGLQRALHLAGTKHVVASLWKVDDQATAALMTVFYEKLWQENKRPVEALREAQLAIYRNPELLEKLATERGQSFAKAVDLLDTRRPTSERKTAHPRLWAAWVLSGSLSE